jgi:hypothetical protein
MGWKRGGVSWVGLHTERQGVGVTYMKYIVKVVSNLSRLFVTAIFLLPLPLPTFVCLCSCFLSVPVVRREDAGGEGRGVSVCFGVGGCSMRGKSGVVGGGERGLRVLLYLVGFVE